MIKYSEKGDTHERKKPLTGRTSDDWTAKKAGTELVLRAAALIVKDNNFLAVKSSDYDVYYTVGGGIEVNESSEEAVIREVYEETGYMLEINRLAFVQERFHEVDERKYHEIVFFYLMQINADFDIPENRNTDQKKETLHWIPIKDLGKFNLVPKFLKTKSFVNVTSIEHIISKEGISE